tara:strand:+ start:303 stop:431 length:129 start_codon:yes stop_codon:yes gene_type:complete
MEIVLENDDGPTISPKKSDESFKSSNSKSSENKNEENKNKMI